MVVTKTQENLRAASTFVYILTAEPGFAQIQGIQVINALVAAVRKDVTAQGPTTSPLITEDMFVALRKSLMSKYFQFTGHLPCETEICEEGSGE